MKRGVMAAALLLLVSGSARAGTPAVKLLWDDCGLGAPVIHKISSCDSDFGPPHKLIVSLEPDGVVDNINGVQGAIDVVVEGGWLPDFWRLDPGGCRSISLRGDATVGDVTPPFSCPQPWSQVGSVASATAFNVLSQSGRILWIAAIPGAAAMNTADSPEWYLFAINLMLYRTSICGGCTVPAQLTASETRLTRPAADPRGDVFIYTGAQTTVSWQTQPTPVVNRTWGQVKSLFR